MTLTRTLAPCKTECRHAHPLSGDCANEKSRFTEERLVLTFSWAGTPMADPCRKPGFSDTPFGKGRKKQGGITLATLKF